jgi:hypothetical protein
MIILPIRFIFISLILISLTTSISAQNLSNPRSIGMGGTGISFLSGAGATFYNPANLMISDDDMTWSILILDGGMLYNRGYDRTFLSNPGRYTPLFQPSKINAIGYPTTGSNNGLIRNWFGDNQLSSRGYHITDIQTIGLAYRSENMSFSLNHRFRGYSSYRVGRGLYDPNFIEVDGLNILDKSISQSYKTWHEVSVGLAWKQELISGWLSDLSSVYVGFNPKLILPIIYTEHDWVNQFGNNGEGDENVVHISTYSGITTGTYTDFFREFFGARSSGLLNSYNPSVLSGTTGYGIAFDAGVTYMIVFGDDIRLSNNQHLISPYNMRFSVAVHDIGFVSYKDRVSNWSSAEQSEINTTIIPVINPEFGGYPLSFPEFLLRNDQSTAIEYLEEVDAQDSRQLLSANYVAGVGLQLNRLLLSVEFHDQLSNSIDESDTKSFHFGNEIQLFNPLHVRSGLIIRPNQPLVYTAGVGLVFRNVAFSAGTYASKDNITDKFRPTLINAGSLTLNF